MRTAVQYLRTLIRMAYDAATLEWNLTNHPPTSDRTIGRFEHLRARAKALGLSILADVPEGREKALALTNLEQTLNWAIAGVARNQDAEVVV